MPIFSTRPDDAKRTPDLVERSAAVVADHHARQPATRRDGAQLANDLPTLQRGVDAASQAFPAVIVDDVEHTEPQANESDTKSGDGSCLFPVV